MDLVDEHDRAGIGFDFAHHRFQPLLEISAVACPRQECAHVELKDRRIGEHVGHFATHDAACQPFRNGGLANARFADKQRIVFLPPAQNLDRAPYFRIPPNQRINAPFPRLRIQVDAVNLQRVAASSSTPRTSRGSDIPGRLAIP